MEKTSKKNPIKVFSCGPIKAAIWLNSFEKDGTLVEVHSVKIDKSYKDKESDEWKTTGSLSAEDLPKVALVAMEAYKFIRVRESEDDS